MQQSYKIAKNYAQALFETYTQDISLQESVLSELKTITNVLESTKDSWSFFTNPGISRDDKKESIKKIFSSKINQNLLNLLFLLIDNKRFILIPEIQNQFNKLVNNSKGITNAQVYSAVELDNNIIDKLKESLENINRRGGKVTIESKVEPALIGGMKIKINDLVYDGSIKGKLENLKQRLG